MGHRTHDVLMLVLATLKKLDEQDYCGSKDAVANRLGLNRQSVGAYISWLKQGGCVERSLAKREAEYKITPLGLRVLNREVTMTYKNGKTFVGNIAPEPKPAPLPQPPAPSVEVVLPDIAKETPPAAVAAEVFSRVVTGRTQCAILNESNKPKRDEVSPVPFIRELTNFEKMTGRRYRG